MTKIKYFCNAEDIEENANEQVLNYAQNQYIDTVCAFTDIHYCDEKAVPVGVAFSTNDYFYPLITGKDIGCGVMYLKISKADWLKPFNKTEHYRAFNLAHTKMTDDGLGGGNHFLSLEEDENNVYIICHTGTRDRGIGLYQHCYGLVQDFSREYGAKVDFIHQSFINEQFYAYYTEILTFGYQRRKNFCLKTLAFLQIANYIKCEKTKIPKDYLSLNFNNTDEKGEFYGTEYEIGDSVHNHIRFGTGNRFVHRKGSTELMPDRVVVIPLSMTRGSLLVKLNPASELAPEALFSCAHGAGRKLSRFDTMKYWKNSLKEKDRKAFKEKFAEMLDRSGNFSSGHIQEFDFAYKDHSEIFKYQPYLKKVTETKPIVTLKYTEI
ncbi:MAG: RtcB family protein [Dinghuibacter sp.]|nr:RtcB family protein [Dinghuibacter sp.]